MVYRSAIHSSRPVIGSYSDDSSDQALSPEQTRLSGAPVLGKNTLDNGTPDFQGVPPQELICAAVIPMLMPDGQRTLVVAKDLSANSNWLSRFHDWPVAQADRRDIQTIIAGKTHTALTERAMTRTDSQYSCRTWGQRPWRKLLTTVLFVLIFIAACIIYPSYVLMGVTGWAVLTLIISLILKISATVAILGYTPPKASPLQIQTVLPKISILVPVFREATILPILVHRLNQLTYPKTLLEVILVLEEKDNETLGALNHMSLPDWMRVIIVPDAGLKTKPRAMNYALDFCQGDIIGIYDAEDAPEPDQLNIVARHFEQAPPDVACLQGILDFYNPRQNWLARCFTIEYATWFRLIMPGLSRLGFTIPLGGTTLFIRRNVLEEIGAWDAHNVTEDADLGFRLARYGYRTEMLPVTTDEEANCHIWPWIRQRSRWLKGYMTTYLVHMRKPRQLWRDLGTWRFLGFQAHFLTALFQPLLAPVLWSFWLLLLGAGHPLWGIWPDWAFTAIGLLFLLAEFISVVTYMIAISGEKHRHLMIYTPTMHLYWPLAAVAIVKSLYEMLVRPFFWDKTAHGISINSSSSSPGKLKPRDIGL